MSKPRIIIADTDISYIIPLQVKFIEEYFEKVELEIITDREYFMTLFSAPQRADFLLVSEALYDSSIQRHNITNIFLMTEQADRSFGNDPGVTLIYKYTSIREIFRELDSKSSGGFGTHQEKEKKETQIVLVYSACGGVGKTTVAMGLCAGLARNSKKALYINASRMQSFQVKLNNQAPITGSDVYSKLMGNDSELHDVLEHVIRKEYFHYVPPFKAALASMGIEYSVYEKIARAAKNAKEFDYIVIDADSTLDEDKIKLLGIADKVVIVTEQTTTSVYATNKLFENISDMTSDRYVFLCNNFEKENSNALVTPELVNRFTVSEYINHFVGYDSMSSLEYGEDSGIQKALFLIM